MDKINDTENIQEIKKENAVAAESQNNKNFNFKNLIKKPSTFFIVAGICVVIVLISLLLFKHYYDESEDAYWGESGYYGLFLAKLNYEDYLIDRYEYIAIEREYKKIENTYKFFRNSSFAFGGIAVLSSIYGVVLIIKKKGGIKIVD